MGDVAQILTVGMPSGTGVYSNPVANHKNDPSIAPPKAPPPPPPSHHPSRALKMTSMSREVMDLISGNQDKRSAALPPIVPAFPVTAIQKPLDTAAPASVKIGNRWINTSKPARKWAWAPFVSSSRTDGAIFRHWVRANVEYAEYPYARFDIHLDPVTYSDEEYAKSLQHETWTRSETDQLMELARKFELRWPIIYDRWIEANYDQRHVVAGPHRKLEDLQHRYYSVAAILSQNRIAQEAAAEVQALTSASSTALSSAQPGALPSLDLSGASAPMFMGASPKAAPDALLMETAAARSLALSDPQYQPLIANIGTGTTNKVFDLRHERERRAHIDQIWHRTKEEEMEEEELRKELRLLDTQIRKVKKAGGHILAAAANGAANGASTATSTGASAGAAASAILSSAASSRNPSRSVTPVPPNSGMNLAMAAAMSTETSALLLDQCFASTSPIPTPQTPYLQSGRLVPPAAGGPLGLSKSLLSRMDAVLAELNVPPRPIPTKRVCDMYDAVRKDILTLLTLQKMALQKEGQLQSKRLKLAKMGGTVGRVVNEETLLGVPPTPTSSASVSSASRGKGMAAPSTGKSAKARSAAVGAGTGNASKGKTAPAKAAPAPATGVSTTGVSVPLSSVPVPAGQAPAPVGVPLSAPMPVAPVTAAKVEVHETLVGKQAKKAAPKRKRKPESKSPNPSVPATTPPAPAATVAPAGSATAAPSTTASTRIGLAEGEAKSSGKKRRKS